MKILAIIISLFLPGIGTMIMGRIGLGIIQLIWQFSQAPLPLFRLLAGLVAVQYTQSFGYGR